MLNHKEKIFSSLLTEKPMVFRKLNKERFLGEKWATKTVTNMTRDTSPKYREEHNYPRKIELLITRHHLSDIAYKDGNVQEDLTTLKMQYSIFRALDW